MFFVILETAVLSAIVSYIASIFTWPMIRDKFFKS